MSLRVALCPRIKNETHNVQFPGFSCQWNGSWYHHLFSAGTRLHFSRCWYVWLAELWPVAVLVSALQWSGGGGRQGSWEVVTSGTRTQLCADTRRGHSSSRTSSHFHLKLEHPQTFSNVTAWQRSRESNTSFCLHDSGPGGIRWGLNRMIHRDFRKINNCFSLAYDVSIFS